MGDGLHHGGQFVAKEHGNDGRRRFAGAEAMVVARRGCGDAQKILMLVHGVHHRGEEEQKLHVLRRGLARLEQVHARVRGQGPVVVLAAAVDAGKGLFMEQADKTVLDGDLFHHLHGQLVVVGGDVDVGKHRGQFVLRGRGFVVFGAGEHAQFPQFLVQLAHEGRDARLQRAEVLVVHLLPLGGAGAKERAAGVFEVGTALVDGAVDEEILLFRADGGVDAAHVPVAKEPQNAQRLAVERFHGAQKRRFLVQHAAGVGIERRGDAQRIVLDKGVAGGVPGGVAAGFEGGAQPARGEGGGVRLALDQLLAGELHDDAAGAGGRQKGVVLFSGNVGQRLEPVGEVRRALGDGPVLHGVGHHVSHAAVEVAPFLNGLLQFFIGIVRQKRAHHRVAEDHGSEDRLNVAHTSLRIRCIGYYNTARRQTCQSREFYFSKKLRAERKSAPREVSRARARALLVP